MRLCEDISLCALLGYAALLPLVVADWQFKSRTDLAPPRLNIAIPAGPDVEKGYLFVAPFAGYPDTAGKQHGPRQAAPYIFRDDGELVWSGYGYYSIWATNFQKARWKDKDVLFSFEGDHNAGYGHGHGHTTILNQHYETIRELRAGNHKLTDKHEFHVVNEQTGLIQIYQPVPADLTPWGASPEQQWIVDSLIQELDIETGELLFEWSSLEHVSPDEAILPINPGQAGSGYNSSDAWDYFHINSVDKDSEGNYLISARDACSVHKINGTTSEIIWRLGGVKSDFELGDNVKFCFQHHARYVSKEGTKEVISLYDNAAHGTEDGRGHEVHTHTFSQGKIIEVDTATWKATIMQAFQPPKGTNLLSKSQGSTQLLANGNVIVNWGSEGALTEYRPDGTPIFHTYMDSGFLGLGVENYRAFRYNWTGLPNETPAIVSLENEQGTTVYVSWNGDTETKAWRFFSVVDEYGSREFLGEVERRGFETALFIKEHSVGLVAAEAVGANGGVLTSTAVVRSQAEVLPPSGGGVSVNAPTYVLYDEQDDQVQMGQGAEKSRWDEHMIFKVNRFDLK
ncbi:arylsulfotransferase family protein [Aspergillus undulatus]|uniref:arylsulfotransferase family protein n=1 Tax=Aspergillus undulatus TaxID=1810928 RepID=UPI003CCCC1CC